MQQNSNSNNIPTYIFALGGIEEIGKNMYIIEHNDEIWIIDCGNKFVNKDIFLGFNCIVCPFDYLVANQNKIKGMIVTHGHEDHIGGIPFLLKNVDIPKIYAGRLTINIIKRKLSDYSDLKKYSFQDIHDESIITSETDLNKLQAYTRNPNPIEPNWILKTDSKYFTIDFFRVCHSIPDAFGICFKTPNGIVCTTGDFRFDFLTSGDESDINKMSIIGQRDVSLLLCESTNAPTPGFSVSEKYIIEELDTIIGNCQGRILLTIFASNLHRIEEIIHSAVKYNRKIILCGHSMINNVESAIEANLLHVDKKSFIDMRDVENHPDKEILFLATGSQGEELAALNQMASGNHQFVKLQPTDTVIFSSNPIPGNFEGVEVLLNKLYKAGVNVHLSNSESKIHSSGHATQTELQLLIKLINPSYLLPIHGEFKMLTALKSNGKEIGLTDQRILTAVNGQKISLLNGKAEVTDQHIELNDNFVDGRKIVSNKNGILEYRTTLSHEGLAGVILLINKKQMQIVDKPTISIKGSFFARESGKLINQICTDIIASVNSILKKYPSWTDECESEINSSIRYIATSYIRKYKSKKPLVRTTLFFVDNNTTVSKPYLKTNNHK